MKKLKIHTNPEVNLKFEAYPEEIQSKMNFLRELIIKTAEEIDSVREIEETLKWGEPSFLSKQGSTIRMDWKKKTPDQYAIYFTCTTDLVPTFKRLYSDVFTFEGDRAIVFQMDDHLPEVVLKRCIAAALTYHKVKQLPMLGL